MAEGQCATVGVFGSSSMEVNVNLLRSASTRHCARAACSAAPNGPQRRASAQGTALNARRQQAAMAHGTTAGSDETSDQIPVAASTVVQWGRRQ